MNTQSRENATPVIDTMQARIAMLVAGTSLQELCRKWKLPYATAWRAMNNIHCGPQADAIRRRLADFIKQTNNTKRKA
jgi:hypothetical protein